EICSRLAPQAEKKQVHIEVSGESVIYEGIPQILDEMIYNICENAIKYNYEQGTVNIWAGRTLQGIKIIISDTGIGIPLEHQERIFERFYRVDKSHSKETGGTGLGLSIVKHGALLHGATIKVTSKEKEGTKIELIF
ncbi:MAG: ATP-binding protein, partial [Lachnospiraceae bacterium]